MTKPKPLPATSITRSATRDSYIIAQALFIAAQTIEERDHPFKEVSNAQDMRLILDTMFPSFKPIFEQQDLQRRAYLAGYRGLGGSAEELQAFLDEKAR